MTKSERGVESGRSWGRAPREVKPNASARRSGVLRHLEGWELGVIAVGIAAIAAALALPRGAEPDVLPLPRVDRKEETRMLETERERARSVEQDPLPYEVRAVGEVFRRYGRADADGDARAASLQRMELGARARSAREIAGDTALLRLRAVQTELFLGALSAWEAGQPNDTELEELGGNFIDKAESSGWLRGQRIVLSLAERAVLFRLRWSELTGLREQAPFAPTANEWRLYYRCLLEHAPAGASDDLLAYVAAAERYDPEYPGDLARGIVQLRLGRPSEAVGPLSAFLAKKPNGRWRLRAQNHLALALAQAGATAP